MLLLGLAVSLVSAIIALALPATAARLAFGPPAALALGLGLVGALRALGTLRIVARYAERLVTHAATFRALAAVRVWLFRGLAVRSAGGLGLLRSGDALSRIVGDVEALDGLYLRILVPGLVATAALPVLWWALAPAGLGVLVAVGGLFVMAWLVLPLVAASGSRRAGARLAQASARLRTAALDTFDGLREVRAYGAEGRMLAEVQAREATLIQAQRAVARLATRATHFANGDTLSITLAFENGCTATLSAILTTPFAGRFALYGSKGWMEIRDRTHPENPTGWDVTSVLRGEAPQTRFFAPHSAVRDNLEAFGRACAGGAPYPVSVGEMRANVRSFAAITRSALSGRIEKV